MKRDNRTGADMGNFEKAVRLGIALVEKAGPETFLSPYSLIAPLAQILGLNTPSMGSGESPYSVISFIFSLRDETALFKEAFAIPLEEKRRVIDELYEMTAPALLGEEEEYIELVINTKYKYAREKVSSGETGKLREALRQKFSLFLALRGLFKDRKADFAHIVHYGYPEDLYREHSFLEKLPLSLARRWREYSFPVVNEIVLDNFPSSGGNTKKSVRGWVIFIANYTQELLEKSELRRRKILQAARLAERLGAGVIGMGGLIASFAQGGQWLSGRLKGAGVTTGHAYTIGNIMAMMEICAKRVGCDIGKSSVAVVGACGSIGSGCVKLLAGKGPERIILIDLNSFDARRKMEELGQSVKGINPGIRIEFSDNIIDIRQAGIVIVATNSPTSLVPAEYLKPGAIVIDDSFPKNVSQALLKQRDDVILLEGGITRLPAGIDTFFARNMPDLMDVPLTRVVSCKETYSCFAETLVLALYGHKGNYGVGYADPRLAGDILSMAEKAGFSPAPLQCFDEAVEDERLERVKRKIKSDYGYLTIN